MVDNYCDETIIMVGNDIVDYNNDISHITIMVLDSYQLYHII